MSNTEPVSSPQVIVIDDADSEETPVVQNPAQQAPNSYDQSVPTRRAADVSDEECVEGLLDAILPLLASRHKISGPHATGAGGASTLHTFAGTGIPAAANAVPLLQDYAGTGLSGRNFTSATDYAIPPPRRPSRPVPVGTQVVFDLETTGLETDCHILQLAAISHRGNFCKYILPKKPISWEATLVHGLSYDGQRMHFKGQPVPCRPIRKALSKFLDFLGDQPVTLFAHNAKRFDAMVLLNAFRACNMLPELRRKVVSYVDTLRLFRDVYPGLPSYKQESLFKNFLHDAYTPHDAMNDVVALKTLLAAANVTPERVSMYCFTFDTMMRNCELSKNKKEMLSSWNPMISSGAISRQTAERAAGSGLGVHHLRTAYRRDGVRGVYNLLIEPGADGRPRVARKKPVLDKISNYIAQNPVVDSDLLQHLQRVVDREPDATYDEDFYDDNFEYFSDYRDDDDQTANVVFDESSQADTRRRRYDDRGDNTGPDSTYGYDNDLYPEHIQRSKIRRTEKTLKEKPSGPCSCSII